MVTFYVKSWYPNTPKQDKDPAKVKWELYEKKGSDIIKLKTFKEGKLQFSENEIGKQYIVVGYLYEPELNNASAMKISVIPTEKVQILSVEVRDINGNKITKPLAYGQKIKVSVRTTGLQGAKLNIDLWEDDETGGGHDDKNTKVSVASQLVPVGKNGIATTEMLIPVNFKKYAEAHGDNGKESAEHEYYVTAYHDGTQREASGNINFTNTKTPTQRKEETRDHLEQKPKRTEPVRGHRRRARKEPPTPTPSRSTPAPSPPAQQQPSQPRAVKKEITTVYITDANDKKISGTVKGGIVKVHILSTGLVGRDIRFKFYEEDVTENELVFEQKFKITKDHFIVDVTLNKVSANKGDDYFEGSEQEFFVDIEVLDTHAHIKSAVIDVDVKALKQDIPTNVTKTKVEQPDAPKKDETSTKKGECFCNRNLTVEETKKIIQELRDSEGIKNYNLFTSQNCPLNDNDKTYEKFTSELNNVFNKYGINTCIRKIHFLAQTYLETDRFRTTVEYSTSGEYYPYIGRGLMQLTWKKNYQIYKSYAKINCVDDYNLISNNLYNSFDSAGWYWKQGKVLSVGQTWTAANSAPAYVKMHNPKYPKNTISYIDEDNKTQKYGTVDFGLIADNDTVDVISYLVNGGSNGLGERRIYAAKLKQIFKYPQNCVNKKTKSQETPTDNKPVTIRLVRKWQTNKSTIGEFSIDDSEIKGYILEEKGPDTTESGKEQRVPTGTYNLVWHSGAKFSKALKLYNNNVSINRAILIHAGNTASDTEGCLLPGKTKSTDFVGQSKKLVKEIYDFVEEKGIKDAKIIITQDYETN